MLRVVYVLLPMMLLHSLGYAEDMLEFYENRAARYPNSAYITGFSESNSKETAQARALAEISMYFNSQIDAQRKSSRKRVNNLITSEAKEELNTSTQSDLFSAAFDTYYDVHDDKWYVFAFIKKNEALQIFESRTQSEIDRLNALKVKIDNTKNYLEKLNLLKQWSMTADTLLKYLDYITVLAPSKRENYRTTENTIINLESIYMKERQDISFSFVTTDVSHRINNTLKGLLEESGYVVKAKNAMFLIETSINMEEEVLSNGFFFRSNVTVNINHGDENIFTYSETLPRYGHKTRSGAVNKNYLEIEKDLKKNFINDFRESIGGIL